MTHEQDLSALGLTSDEREQAERLQRRLDEYRRTAFRPATTVPAGVVVYVWRRIREGRNLASVAEDLTRAGIPTPRDGARWWRASVLQLLERAEPFAGPDGGAARTLAVAAADRVRHLLADAQQDFSAEERDVLDRAEAILRLI